MDLGVLFTLPVESVAVRAVLATLATVLLGRLLLRRGLHASGPRVVAALAPAAALVAVVLVSWQSLYLPALMLPVDSAAGLPIPVRDGYLHFAPIAVPLLVATWVGIATTRLGWRLLATRRVFRRASRSARAGSPPAEVVAVARRLAADLRVPVPDVAVVPTCPGGAYVAGRRRPVLVIGRDLLNRLDEEELEGVIAHELAHVRRRDNLVALAVGAVRDVTFFIPGGGWALRQLHREREVAADQVAVRLTGRPGALASGLLKVLEGPPVRGHACAALVPEGTLVGRVQRLVDDRPPVSRGRVVSEVSVVAGAVSVAVLAALVLPSLLAGAERERDAVALLWSTAAPTSEVAVPTAEARAFTVYRRSSLGVQETSPTRTTSRPDSSVEYRRSTLYACGTGAAFCPDPQQRPGLGLRPRPTMTFDGGLTRRWRATAPLVGAGDADGLRVYWLQRVE